MRRIAFLAGFLALLAASPLRADNIDVRDAALRPTVDGMVLDADFAFDLTPRLAEAVANGVPLYFRIEFEMTRPRWWWFDERAASALMQMRLSYHALSRHYRLAIGGEEQSLLQQNFPTLDEALAVMKHVRSWLVVDRTVGFSRSDYEAAVRMRLDTSLLPKPFQLSALTSRELHLESPWKRFIVRSPQQLPAPVESREPTRPEGR
jgi:uncharacterized protein DUF4390